MLLIFLYGVDKLVLVIIILNYWIIFEYVFVGRYDIEGFFSGQYSEIDVEFVFQLGILVCGGYVNLFEVLCM